MVRKWVTIAECSRQVDVDQSVIRKQIKGGKITRAAWKYKKPGSKQIVVNVDQVIKDRAANLGQQGKAASDDQPEEKKTQTIQSAGLQNATRAEAEAWQAKFKAALLKLDLEERQGQLLKKVDVEKDAFNMARRVRDALLNIPDRISAELASMTDTHVINDKLTTEITQALEELSA